MKKSLIVGLLASVMFLSFASIVLAVEGFPTKVEPIPDTVTNETSLFVLFARAANIIFTGLLIIASLFILLAAFQFITGGGNAEALEQARGKLIWGVVGIIVGLAAKALPGIVQSILGRTP